MICKNCGTRCPDGSKFCDNCGSPLQNPQDTVYTNNSRTSGSAHVQPRAASQRKAEPQPNVGIQPTVTNQTAAGQPTVVVSTAAPMYRIKVEDLPGDLKPISMWGYFGYQLLFAIPIIGFILSLVFAFGGTANINLRNFARSRFCLTIIIAVILIIIFVIIGVSLPW